MSRRKKIMGHMVVGHMVVIGQIVMTWSNMTNWWTLRIGEGIGTCTILVLVLTGTMIDIVSSVLEE